MLSEPLFPEKALRRGEYPWLQGHPKAGTPPKGTPVKSNDQAAKRGAAAMSYATKR